MERIRFVDLRMQDGQRLAYLLGVEKATSVVSYTEDDGKWQTSVFRLVEGG